MSVRQGRWAASAPGVLEHTRYEIFPTASVEQAVHAHVPPEVTVTVTTSPAKGLEPTLALAESLAGAGYNVVPHLSARLVVDAAHLKEIAERLVDAGITDVFMPAGDSETPAGIFDGALPALQALAETRPFARVGITGYPQSHPRIDDDVTVQSMWDKRLFADYIVSNLCFDARAISRWIERVRRRGVELPLYVGLAGPVERTKLLSMATKIGVGESTRFLSSHLGWFARLGAPGGYSPNRLLDHLAGSLAAPESKVEGLHVFTFNQLKQTEAWRQSLLARLHGAAGGAAG